MPQMGESIAEGTIVRWVKKVGDHVDRDEPLFEISTDKVDAEIPSPAAGVLIEIRAKEGETVAVNHVVAIIGEAARRGPAPRARPAAAAAPSAAPQERCAAIARAAEAAEAQSADDCGARSRRPSSGRLRRARRGHHADRRLGLGRARDQAGHPGVHGEGAGRGRAAAPPARSPRDEVVPMTVMRRRRSPST